MADIVVGALFAVFALCQFVGGPFWGNMSDRIGRKAVLIVSQIGATIGWTMLAFAPSIGGRSARYRPGLFTTPPPQLIANRSLWNQSRQ